VERHGRLNSKQLKDLSDELADLAQKQADARQTEVYIRMTPQEIQTLTYAEAAFPQFT